MSDSSSDSFSDSSESSLRNLQKMNELEKHSVKLARG